MISPSWLTALCTRPVVFQLRLLSLELPSTDLSDSFLRVTLGSSPSWAFTHSLPLCDQISHFPCPDCCERGACSQAPDAVLPDFHCRRCLFLVKTQWLQPVSLPNAAVPCDERVCGFKPRQRSELWSWWRLWSSASPTAGRVVVGQVGWHLWVPRAAAALELVKYNWWATAPNKVLWNLREEVLTGCRRFALLFCLK